MKEIKLGSVKNFLKALPKGGNAFKYLRSKFTRLSDAKLKEDPQIRKLVTAEQFLSQLSNISWLSLQIVFEIFLGNYKAREYGHIFDNLLISLKIHVLHSFAVFSCQPRCC